VSPKVLAKAGDSLADIYDVEGSIAGVDQLISREVNLFHEMGHNIFSERMTAFLVPITSGAVAQSTAFDNAPTTVFEVPIRILGCFVISNQAARLQRVSVFVRDATAGGEQDFPIFSWETAAGADFERTIRMVLAGAAAANVTMYVPGDPGSAQSPSMIMGRNQPGPTWGMVMRGVTTAFGAGTITTQAFVYTAFAQRRGISSRGLPIPGW